MKHIEDTPWWICDPEDTNYIAYSDTDSIYVHAEPLLRHLYPDFEEMSSEDKDDKLENIALKYQDIITDSYSELATDCFNAKGAHRLEMKTECVIRAAYFRATRRYAQWITKQEGITKESLDVKGLEFKKANFAIFYDDLKKPKSGGTGHTMKVCEENGLSYINQTVWFEWLNTVPEIKLKGIHKRWQEDSLLGGERITLLT